MPAKTVGVAVQLFKTIFTSVYCVLGSLLDFAGIMAKMSPYS